MKKLFSTTALAVLCTLSFGQGISNINFTGMLAKTTFAQYSITTANNGTIDKALASWVSAIAAPTVDVSNIADMALTLSSGSLLVTAQSVNGAPVTTTTIPTNYTGSEQLLSGTLNPLNYTNVYISNTAGTAYRNVAIFIHKLTPAPLPIIIPTNNPGVQPGFAQCGEIVNAGTNVQLHTNGQSIYLAFNSAADVVKFQVENGASSVDATKELTDSSKIYVEKSADLVSWSNMQTILLPTPLITTPATPFVKTNYSIAVNDPAARYVRLRIAGLYGGRGPRKANIRSIAVLTKPIITWDQDFTNLKTTSDPVVLTATSTVSSLSTPAGSDLSYVSSNLNVVSVVSGMLYIVGPGTATLTAKQAANSNYAAADDVVKTVVVSDPNAVVNVKEDAKLVYATSKGIVSTMEGKLNIYSVTGMLVKSTNVNRNQLITMPSGVYIVRTSINGNNFAQIIVL